MSCTQKRKQIQQKNSQNKAKQNQNIRQQNKSFLIFNFLYSFQWQQKGHLYIHRMYTSYLLLGRSFTNGITTKVGWKTFFQSCRCYMEYPPLLLISCKPTHCHREILCTYSVPLLETNLSLDYFVSFVYLANHGVFGMSVLLPIL